MTGRRPRPLVLVALAAVVLVAAVSAVFLLGPAKDRSKTRITAYFDNTNGLFTGDEVRILGVPVGRVETIEPQPDRAKVTMYVESRYAVPADAMAAVLSPKLVTARAVQLTPAYTGGPKMANDAVIPIERTAVPVEWDDLRRQLEKLTDALAPTEDGGASALGEFVTTAADNLRGRGANIREAVVQMAEALSILGDHSDDIFSTIRSLSVVVNALHDTSDAMGQMNRNLAAVSALLADDPNEIGQVVSDLNAVVGDAASFVADNREALGTTVDRLASITTAVNDSTDDIEQALHVAPNVFQNVANIYQPSQAALTGILAATNFNNPISFLCGAIQAASRLGNEQSAKLCVQYLAPIVKNRQWNALPLGVNPFVGQSARPNELTYTEDWMRPDYVPPLPAPVAVPAPPAGAPLAAEQAPPVFTDPSAGLTGLMLPPGGGS